jgi:DNA (cytosine-5)-methyltransferase 1
MVSAVDFFCGAGGMTRGLLDAEIAVVPGVDVDPDCRQTYELNNRPAKFLGCDVRDLPNPAFGRVVARLDPCALLFAACAPCQPFSKQRTTARDDAQRTLLVQFARLVGDYLPEYIMVENVPGIRAIGGRSSYRRLLSTLERCGYRYDAADIDAKDYGVPQTRRRHVLLARRSGEVAIPAATHGRGLLPYATVRQAIGRFPPVGAGEKHHQIPNHRASGLSAMNLKRIRKTPPDGGDRRAWPDGLVLKCHRGDYDGHTDVYGRMWWDRPAPALTCKCHSLSNGRYGHPEQDRAVSLREAASLQTFPDTYVFYGSSKESVGRQIGNAVPAVVATCLARALVPAQARTLSRAVNAESSAATASVAS